MGLIASGITDFSYLIALLNKKANFFLKKVVNSPVTAIFIAIEFSNVLIFLNYEAFFHPLLAYIIIPYYPFVFLKYFNYLSMLFSILCN